MPYANLARIAEEELNAIRAVQKATRYAGALEVMRKVVHEHFGSNGHAPQPLRAERRGAVWATGIKAAIEKMLPKLGGADFTFKDVVRVLAENGRPIAAKNHRSAVGQVLNKLVKQGSIVPVRKGVGGSPSLYRVPVK